MDNVVDHITWLRTIYELGVIDKVCYSYELIKIGRNEGYLDHYLEHVIEKNQNEES